MHTIDLAYVGRGIHEELVAYVADQQNYYEQEAVHVALRDGRAWHSERVRWTATIGLGRAVLSRLTDGIPWTVLCVNTQRPLFWLLARDPYGSVEGLKGRRVGIHSPSWMSSTCVCTPSSRSPRWTSSSRRFASGPPAEAKWPMSPLVTETNLT